MNLVERFLQKIATPTLLPSERARLRVQLSKVLEETGDYEGAREAMGELWSRIGEPPALDDLDEQAAAEVLQQVGVLTSCIGSAKQVEGAQEIAKDLIGESITLFEALQNAEKVAEGQTDLAICYWREGRFDEARAILGNVLNRLADSNSEVKALALIRSAIVERTANRLNDALRICTHAIPVFEAISNHSLKGKFHVGYANILMLLAEAESRGEYIDNALLEFTAASFHFEQAGNERYHARVENNLALLFLSISRFNEAHEHAERARKIFAKLKDKGSVAQVDDTRAKVLLAEGRNEEAERVARGAVRALEKGDERALLAEALTTRGVALARLKRYGQAREVLEAAASVAEEVGDKEGAGQAALALVEELGRHLRWEELGAAYVRAAGLLEGAQHRGIKERLVASARELIAAQVRRVEAERQGGTEEGEGRFELPKSWEGFSYKEEVARYERFLIERALKDAGGVVTRAGQLLGFKHHYSLVVLLNKRHKDLLHARSPVVRRRKSMLRPAVPPERGPEGAARAPTILHVEDNNVLADSLRDALQLDGWRVESYANGTEAQQKLRGGARYDLLLFDYDLPGVSGLELARLARRLPHRRRTPIIMLSASDCEPEAWHAGVDAFLRKPDDVLRVAEVAARLVSGKS